MTERRWRARDSCSNLPARGAGAILYAMAPVARTLRWLALLPLLCSLGCAANKDQFGGG